MKLIINIPEKAYEMLKSKSELDNIAESIIANGIPYEERLHGEWVVDKTNRFGDRLNCSICGARPRRSEYGYDLHDNFCHSCGANMQKGDAE